MAHIDELRFSQLLLLRDCCTMLIYHFAVWESGFTYVWALVLMSCSSRLLLVLNACLCHVEFQPGRLYRLIA